MKHPKQYYANLAERLGLKFATYSEDTATFETPYRSDTPAGHLPHVVVIPGWFAAYLTGALDGQAPEREFLVTVNYQTEGGDASSFRKLVTARSEDEAVDKANAAARRSRPKLMKIDGGDVWPA